MRYVAHGVLAAFLLAACQTSVQAETAAQAEANRVAHDKLLCRKYGYEEGTDDFTKCVNVLAERRHDAQAQKHAGNKPTPKSEAEKMCDARQAALGAGSICD
jgi:hypothetical protein